MPVKKSNIKQLQAEIKKLRSELLLLKKNKKTETPSLEKTQWNSFFKYSKNSIIVVNKKLEIIDVNKVPAGKTKKSVLGKNALSFVSPDSQSVVKSAIAKVFKTKKPVTYNCKGIQTKSGQIIYSSTATPIVENKKVIAAVIEGRDITAQITAEQHLVVAEQKFRMLTENAADIISRYSVYPERKLDYISPSVKNITGYSQEEFYKDPLLGFKIIHPDDLPVLQKLDKEQNKHFKKGQLHSMVVRWVRKDKKIIWIEIINRPIFDNKKRLIAVEAVGRDITERKKLEEAKEFSEYTFSQVLNNINELVYYVKIHDDGTRSIQYLSDQIEKLVGLSKEKYKKLGKDLIKYCHPDDVPDLIAKAEKLKKDKKPQQFIFRFKNPKTKKYIWLEERITPQFDEKGKHVGNFGITADVTERVEGEKRIKENEERFRMLAENAMDVIYRYTIVPEPRYEYVSPSIFKMSGYTPEEFYADPFIAFKIIPAEDLHLLGDSEESLKTKKKISGVKDKQVVLRWKKKDGTIIWTETRTYDVYDKQGNKIAIEGISRDVTLQKLSEDQLKESEARFKMLSNVAFEGIVFSENGIIVDANDQFLKMFGFKNLKEVRGKNMIDDFVVKEQQNAVKKYAKINSTAPLEVKAKRKDGSSFLVETKSQNIALANKVLRATVIYDITRRKQNEFELRQSINNYKSLVDYSPDGVVIHIDGKMIFANPSALKIIGAKTFAEIENIPAFDIILPEYHQTTLERIKKTKNGEELEFTEIKIKSLDNRIVTIETKPIAIKFNGIDAIQVVFHDVSTQKQLLKEQLRAQLAEETTAKLQQEINERIKTAEKLKEAQKYTRMLIDSSLDMICASDRNGYIIEFNIAAQQTFGYTSEEIIGKHVSALYANPGERIKITDEELYTKGVYAGEVINKKKNGELFVAYLSASVLKDDEGKIIGAMGVSRDISELKKAENELIESEERLKKQSAKLNAVIESSSHVIWTIDREHNITSFNKNFAKHMQKRYGVDAHIGLSMVQGNTISTPEYNKFWIEKYDNVFKGKSEYFETKLIDKDGDLVWREIYLNPIFDENGNVTEISGIGHDITEKKLAEEKIKQSLQEKEVLLKEVHHRVKNNLQVISSILNLQSSYVKDSGTLGILKESQNRIKSMAFIHESLYQTKDFTSINFSEYVVNLANNLLHSYSNIEQEIKLKLDIQNVFLNLDLAIPCGLIINEIVSNALKYAFVEKHEQPEISIQMKTDGENLTLVISDNGVGLPQKIDFRNTESLGLQLVVTLTDQLNGTIELDSTNGTKYKIIFNQNQAKNRI
jgi:PAS domain S-box-containing protein